MVANVDTKTGYSYGVVSMNSLVDWVYDEFINRGQNTSFDDYRDEHGIVDNNEDEDWARELIEDYEGEEENYSLNIDGMRLELSWLGGAPLVWVLESPHTAQCPYCSPCCPNAGDLDSKSTGDEAGACTAYDLPADWYAAREDEPNGD